MIIDAAALLAYLQQQKRSLYVENSNKSHLKQYFNDCLLVAEYGSASIRFLIKLAALCRLIV